MDQNSYKNHSLKSIIFKLYTLRIMQNQGVIYDQSMIVNGCRKKYYYNLKQINLYHNMIDILKSIRSRLRILRGYLDDICLVIYPLTLPNCHILIRNIAENSLIIIGVGGTGLYLGSIFKIVSQTP